tara:strand:- start:74 stop:823 length:750 start_codon:yes stop_codon:yes gene_type:complete
MDDKVVNIKGVNSPELNSLKDISNLVKKLVKEYSKQEIYKRTEGLDKNVIYRLENEQNVTLDNFLKLKNAFPDIFKIKVNSKAVGKVPIVGQIIEEPANEECKVRPLNPTQPSEFIAPSTLIKRFMPMYAYYYVSKTAYNNCVHLFSTAEIDYEKVNKQCIDRLILAFPDNDKEHDVYFGTCHLTPTHYEVRGSVSQNVIHKIPVKNETKWAKWICMLPFSMMEYAHQPNTEQFSIDLAKLDNVKGKLF